MLNRQRDFNAQGKSALPALFKLKVPLMMMDESRATRVETVKSPCKVSD